MSADDEAAFTGIYEANHATIHALLLGRTSDPDASRDLLQETFLRLWRWLDDVRPLAPDRQRAWLVAVARNLVVDRYRTEATGRVRQQAAAGELHRRGSGEAGVAERVEQDERLDHLLDAIAELPEEERVILSMAVVAEMPSHQIAATLDMPAGTVRYRLHRARRRLAAALDLEG